MASDISFGFFNHLTSPVINLAVCTKVVRKDGAVFGFTNHNRDIILDIPYRAGSGMTPSALQAQIGTAIDNADVEWVFLEDQISEREMRGGLFNNAEVFFFLVCYNNLDLGILRGPKGTFGIASLNEDGMCSIQFRSLAQKLKSKICALTSLECRAKRLGDPDCRFNMGGLTADGYKTRHLGWVSTEVNRRGFFSNLNNTYPTLQSRVNAYSWETVTWSYSLREAINYRVLPVASFDGSRFTLDPNPNIRKKPKVGDTAVANAIRISDNQPVDFPLTVRSIRRESNDAYSFLVGGNFWPDLPNHTVAGLPDEFFQNGILRWLTGSNTNLEVEVLSHSNQGIVLQEQMPFDINVLDSFIVEVGCSRVRQMCHDRFDNVINFVGEPDILPYEKVNEVQKK